MLTDQEVRHVQGLCDIATRLFLMVNHFAGNDKLEPDNLAHLLRWFDTNKPILEILAASVICETVQEIREDIAGAHEGPQH